MFSYSWRAFANRIITLIKGNDQYQKYLNHLKQFHPSQNPLSKRQFYAKKEQEKWDKINRCC